MKVLVIDTALNACTAAVFDGDRPLGVRVEPMAKGHQERIGGLVRDAVADAGGFDGIERIGVTVGPGSFTGLRVGLAFAQGLGAALGVPVVGISTLAGLARSKHDELIETGVTAPKVAAAIDARRGQVYIQTFRDDFAFSEPEALAIDTAFERHFRNAVWSLVGSGAPLLAEAMSRMMPAPPPGAEMSPPPEFWADLITVPTPAALAALTIAADPAEAPPTPLYLRAPDAAPPTRLPGQPRPPKVVTEAVTDSSLEGLTIVSSSEIAPGLVPVFAAIHAEAFSAPWDAAAFDSLLGQAGVFAVSAPDGFILCRVVLDEAEILTLAVRPAARRAGLGARLTQAAADIAARAGAISLFLEVAEDNAAARALYARLCFVETGRRRNYYEKADGSRVDARLLALNLQERLPSG